MFDINMNNVVRNNLTNRNEIKKSLNNTPNPNAFYMGIVTNTNDPYKLGRVQVRIPAIHRYTNESNLLFIR